MNVFIKLCNLYYDLFLSSSCKKNWLSFCECIVLSSYLVTLTEIESKLFESIAPRLTHVRDNLIVLLQGFFLDVLNLLEQFFNCDFCDAVTTEPGEQGNRQDCQVAQQKIVDDGANVGEDNTAGGYR